MKELFGINYPFNQARLIAFGAPFEGTACFKKGTAKGPEAVRKASTQIEAFDYLNDVEVLDRNPVHGLGNLKEKSMEKLFKAIEEKAIEIRKAGKTILLLGGEHSISLPALKAVQKEKPVLVVFDAHADLREEFEGKKISHATVMKRILGFHEKKDFIQLGVRSLSRPELEFIKENRLKVFFIEEIKKSLMKVKKALQEKTKNRKIYLSIDIDVFDPSIAPGTGTPEHNGLLYPEFRELLESVKGKIIGIDLVEVLPDRELITPLLAARIIVGLLA
ncbi:agmatinase, partial [archaeon]|nr:agmatinase [archaeon]